jgi:hypothetical protein
MTVWGTGHWRLVTAAWAVDAEAVDAEAARPAAARKPAAPIAATSLRLVAR